MADHARHRGRSRAREDLRPLPLTLETDTIAAIATAPGQAAVGVLRISGQAAAVRLLAERLAGGLPPARRAVLRQFRDGEGQAVDEGLLLWMPAPHSYTGEDILELQTHGSPVVLALLHEAALTAGARPARPGEFTERAWLNGRMDLLQAEAVADLIAAGSRGAARLALRAMGGEASAQLQALETRLASLRAEVEARIDFPEDLPEDAARTESCPGLARLQADVCALAEAARRGRHARRGLRVVIVGPPNAGKSLLYNRLLGADRAMVSPEAGTTRDALEAELTLAGLCLTLCDTAGLRDTASALEAEGVRRARAALETADVWLFVSAPDVAAEAATLLQELRAARPQDVLLIEVQNKADLLAVPAEPCTTTPAPAARSDQSSPPHAADVPLAISALHGTGMAALEACLHAQAAQLDQGAIGLMQARHASALAEIEERLAEAAALSAAGSGPELAAEALRQAATAFDRLFGRHADVETLLGEIFGRFCIGK